MSRPVQSLRERFLFLALLVWLLLLPASFYTQNLVDEASRKGMELIHEQEELGDGLKRLKNALQGAEAGTYQYAFLLEEPVRNRVLAQLIEAHRQIDRLEGSSAEAQLQRLEGHIGRLRPLLVRLSNETDGFFELMSHIESRYPAVPIQVATMNPTDREFMGVASLVIDTASPQEATGEIHRHFRDLRYNWIQMVNAGRVVMMSRSGVFGIPEGGMEQFRLNRDLYADAVDDLLQELRLHESNDNLSFEQSEALGQLSAFKERFDEGYDRAITIYASENWRTDLPYLRDRLRPLFAEIWEALYLLEERLGELSTENLFATLDTADTLSELVWIIFGVITAIILLAYWLFEYAILRPIAQVARALEAEGIGASYVPEIRVRTRETNALLDAFSGMREQVRSRQVRMQAILDNAAEGIITIDERGTIEIFNNAAQQLFGYSAEEAIGHNVSLIVPHPHKENHDAYLERYAETGEQRIMGAAREVDGQHKDGSLFPISLKVSEINIAGRRLFTALVEDIGERKAMMDYLRHLAEHDTVTGLFNRQYFLAELERAVARSRRMPEECCSLLYIDLDNFKYVNDTLGHQAGDRVLMEVSDLLDRRSRKADLLARLGGDEFAVLLYNLDLAGAETAADGFRQMLADYVFKYEGKVVDVGCSIGVAQLTDHVKDKEELMSQADVACHIAKRGGRNRVHVYQRRDQERVATMETDMGWSLRIKAAIEEGHFRFARQPIADAHSGEVRGYEILLRMEDEHGDLIMPAGFLPAAERFGLLTAIDHWVVKHAIADLAGRLGDEPKLRYAINLSAKAIDDGTIFTTISDALEANHVPAEALTFEVTETQAVANLAHAVEFLKKLRILGCRTALDDFGAGYCSFAYLKEMPVDHVKIDGSFVRNICDNDLQRAMVKAMVDIAGTIGIRTVAEFVEDEQCLEVLRGLGVDAVQGYLIGRPELI